MNFAGMMRSGPGSMMGTSGLTMQPKGKPHESLTVLASGMTARVNDVMRGRGAPAIATVRNRAVEEMRALFSALVPWLGRAG